MGTMAKSCTFTPRVKPFGSKWLKAAAICLLTTGNFFYQQSALAQGSAESEDDKNPLGRPTINADGWSVYRIFSQFGLYYETLHVSDQSCQARVMIDLDVTKKYIPALEKLGMLPEGMESSPLAAVNSIGEHCLIDLIPLVFNQRNSGNICSFSTAYHDNSQGRNTYRIMEALVFSKAVYNRINWNRISPQQIPEVALTYTVPDAFTMLLLRESQGFWKK